MNVCIIPAKGTSRRIPKKNIRSFFGKPIIAYSIETASKSGLFDHIYVSTEDEEVAIVSNQYGAGVIARPPELAEIGTPDCGTQEVTRHALMTLGIKDGYACCVYPCAPMLEVKDLKDGYDFLKFMDTPVAMAYFRFVFVPGWYYWGHAYYFINAPEELSSGAMTGNPQRWIDINTMRDWRRAEQMYAKLHGLQCAS